MPLHPIGIIRLGLLSGPPDLFPTPTPGGKIPRETREGHRQKTVALMFTDVGQPPWRRSRAAAIPRRRIGRLWQDSMRCMLRLNARGVRIRSLDPLEARWTAYLDAEPDSVEASHGHAMMLFGSWVADQEAAAQSRRTKAGLVQALAQGKTLGGPRKLRAEDYQVVRMQEAGLFLPEIGKRLGVSRRPWSV